METIKNLLSDGRILYSFSLTHAISVCPALGIDKVRFSLIKQGTGGKDSSDIYLDVKDFWNLCTEIKSGIFLKKIKEDNGPYPSAYKWQKGEDGSKILVIGGGQKGIRVQTAITKDGKTDRKMIVVAYDDFRYMAELFDLIIGKTSFVKGSIYNKYYDAYWDAANKWKPKEFSAKDDGDYTPSDEAEKQSAKTEDKPVVAEIATFGVKTVGEFKKKKNFEVVSIIVKDTNESAELYFDEAAQSKKFFATLKENSTKGVEFSIEGEKKGKSILFRKRVKT